MQERLFVRSVPVVLTRNMALTTDLNYFTIVMLLVELQQVPLNLLHTYMHGLAAMTSG